MTPEISLIVCAHNPRKAYLERTLAALRQQTLAGDRWELLLVDNASSEPLATAWDLSWHPHSRHLHEDKLGLTPARLCGIHASAANLIVFVDDDNLLANDYLEMVVKIAARYPDIGAYGGGIRPEFEAEPPAWTRPYWEMLAIREVPRDLWANFESLPCTPCGAGLCVRSAVARHYADTAANDPRRRALDRTGKGLVSYGDIDLAWCACDLGMGIGQFSALGLTHLIPMGRLEKSYLLQLAEAVHYSSEVLACSRGGPKPRPASLRSRLTEKVRTWLLPRTAAEFKRAALRGRSRAAADLSAAAANAH